MLNFHYLSVYRGRATHCISLCLRILVLSLLVIYPVCAEKNSSVVLVTHVSSPLKSLTTLQIRRLYLGFPVKNEHVNRPVINRSTEALYRDFLKNVMHMTRDGYKRKIIRRVFRHGKDYIRELDSLEEIAAHLDVYTNDVVFVRRSDLHRLDNVKVVVRLW